MLDQSILPPNASQTDFAVEAATRIPAEMQVNVGNVGRVADCSERLLPWLAWAFSVDTWDNAWPDAIKRAVIAASVAVHRRKGTIGAIRQMLTVSGYPDADIIEAGTAPRLNDGHTLSDGHRVHDLQHWAEYSVVVTQPINKRAADALAVLLALNAPARCRLKRIITTVGLALNDGHLLDDGSALDATYVFERTT